MSKKINFKIKIGMRVIKTAIAVTLCLYISLIFNLDSPIFMCIPAITSMKSSLSESYNDVKKRMFSAIFGVILGVAFSYIPAGDYIRPLLGGLGIIIIIYILQVFNMKQMVLLSCLVFIAGFTSKTDKFIYGFNRILGTFLGIIIGIAVNYLISSPNVYVDFISEAKNTLENTRQFIMELISKREHNIDDFEDSYNNTIKQYELLLSEKNTPLHVDFDMDRAKRITDLLQDIHLRFNLLNSFDKSPYVSKANKQLINEVFSLTLVIDGDLEGELNSVFNYHMHRILENILILEKLVGENNETE
ncbi:FUSC family protein [Anaerosphaera multitolerans]|uniref:FUSC family protein n=1 Tax=Anaerosphaera multitolerans TaxID=2487351 RepID=A0A437S9W6_9FIRM|nr:aromatic acid exporter family protein [Anaerosphaera multitolerans]RVU55607.1 hypothetical protein EF514_02435 [Anaerosphaera multitolerans]